MAGTDRPKINKGGTVRGPVEGSVDAPFTLDVPGPEIEEVDYEEEKQRVQPVDVRVLKRDADQPATMTEITLNGVDYTVTALVSASTGEAEVYKLTKGANTYALKLYYAGTSPDMAVVDTLKKIAGTGFLVDIIDYGKWTSPQGDVRNFELMPFYTGGELRPGELRGNAQGMKAIAAAMMMAVRTAHTHNILHRDIKPENFMYADESHSQLLLTDFGIASTFCRDDKGKMVPLKLVAKQWRTKIYAAPETYTVIDNEIEYPDTKSDYYSLGMALLTLWSGDSELGKLDERKLLSLKRFESGTLPYPDDMPPSLLQLIKGLTVRVSGHRWGWDEFERWARGENVAVYADDLRTEAAGLDILYNGRTGQHARSLPELAELMIEDKNLAAQYLYTGQIAKWLHMGGYPEIAAQVNDYVTRQYPTNREAAVLATAYLLDVDMPFISPTGKKLHTDSEIANDMAHNSVKYLPMMADKDSPLFVYFRAGGVDEYAQKFVPMAKKGHNQSFYAVWQMLLTLDPSAPFPVIAAADAKTYTTVDTIEQLVGHFAKIPAYAYANSKLLEAKLLYDEAFIMWLAHRDAALAGRIQSKISQEENTNGQLYFYIWYMLDPTRNFLLQKDQSKMFSIEQIAGQINREYVGLDSDTGLTEQLQDLKENRLYYYLKAKEMYKDKFDYIAYCFDFNTKDRRNQCGPYDKCIATFKAIKALNGDAVYYFPETGQTVGSVEDLKEVPVNVQQYHLRHGKLREWLAVEFQENPFADLSEELTFETLTGEYTDALEEIDSKDPAVERYYEAEGTVNGCSRMIDGMLNGNYIWRGLFALFVALPLLGVAALSIFGGIADFASPSGVAEWIIAAGMLSVGFRAILSFTKVEEWMLWPFGKSLAYKLTLHRWAVAAMYSLAIAAVCWMLESHGDIGRYVFAALCLFVLGWRYKVTIYDYPLMQSAYDDAIHPNEGDVAIEAMYFAYHPDIKEFESEILERQDKYYKGIKAARYFGITRTLWSLFPVALLIAIYIPFSPACERYIKTHDPQKWERVYGEKKQVSATKDVETTTYYADVNKGLTVRELPSTHAAKLGSLGPREEIQVISIDDGWAKIVYGNRMAYVNAYYIKQKSEIASTEEAKAESPKTDVYPVNKVKSKREKASTAAPEPKPKKAPVSVPKVYTLKPNYIEIDVFSAKNTQNHFIIGSLKNGDTFEVLAQDDIWTKIIYKGRDAYVKTMMIVPSENQ